MMVRISHGGRIIYLMFISLYVDHADLDVKNLFISIIQKFK